ncbi:phosphate-starvation-inducible E-like protein [Labilibacter sediminis]|nr:phosphate-starvation-inducible E-like protein [Labilibacter sediminis]
MEKIIKYIEKFLICGVLIALSFMLLFAFVDIVYEIHKTLVTPPIFVIESARLMDLFSLFLILLIGLELLETIKAYLKNDVVHVELVILVAIIAISRKVIVWDFSKNSHSELISLSVMILALGLTYFLVKRAGVKFKIKKGIENKE